MITEYLKLVIGTFKNRKTRTLLTLIGIVIGIAAVVSLISLGKGLQDAINQQFQVLGIDKIIIIPGSSMFSNAAGPEITIKDLEVIKKVKGVNLAGGYIYKVAKVKFSDETQYTWVHGLPLDDTQRILQESSAFEIENGRDLKTGDTHNAVITVRILNGILFEKPVKIGATIEIENQKFKVVGSYKKIGNPQDDSAVIIPLKTARELFNEEEKLDYILARVSEGEDPSSVAERIKKELRKYRGVGEGEEDFTIQTTEQLMDSFKTIFNIIQAVLIGIAGISLLVGGVGITTTMYTSVLERTSEIGIMKAIGAKNSSILAIFLFESGILGLIGGIMGVLVGIGLSKLVEIAGRGTGVSLIQASFPWYLLIGALAFSFMIGCLAGALPAAQAAKLKPVDALRYE